MGVSSGPMRNAALRALLGVSIAVASLAAMSPLPARAAVIPLNGELGAAPVWAAGRALALVRAGGGYSLESIDPAAGGEIRERTTLSRRFDIAHLGVSGALQVLQGANWECAGGCKYQGPYLTDEELSVLSPGGGAECLFAASGIKGCEASNACLNIDEALVSEGRLVYESCAREGEDFTVVGEGSTRVSVPQIAHPEALAGPWLVGLAPGWRGYGPKFEVTHEPLRLIERNLLTGAEPLQIDLGPRGPHVGQCGGCHYPALATVQEDGTIVYLPDSEGHGELWTASPGTPTPRPLGQTETDIKVPELSFPGPSLILKDGRLAERQTEGRITLAGLDGSQSGTIKVGSLNGFDFDGSRVLAASTPCGRSFLVTWAPGEAQPAVPAGTCPTARVSRVQFTHRSIRVTLTCTPSSQLGCPLSYVTISPLSAESSFVTLLPGAGHTLSIPLNPRRRRWLARHRHRTLTVTSVSLITTPQHSLRVRIP